MTLKQKIQQDTKLALKEKRERELSALRMLLSAVINKEKEKRYKIVDELRSSSCTSSLERVRKNFNSFDFANARVSKEKPELKEEELVEKSQLTDDEVIEVVSSEVKKRREAILEFEKGKRQDLVEKERRELEILQKYLPEQLSEEEIRELAKEAIDKVGAKELKEMGKVMAELMPKIKGKADGGLVSKIVKELLIGR